MRRSLCAVVLLPMLQSCSVWFFSGETWIDRSRPVVLVETTGGVEFGAATEYGVLTLGRTGTEGPCRVHYFLGPTPLVEAGTLTTTGSVFTEASIDLKTQAVRVLDRAPTQADELVAMWTPDGEATTSVAVTMAHEEGVTGSVLQSPSVALPAGAAILRHAEDDSVQFVGLVAGKATLPSAAGGRSYYVFAGLDRVRELLATPRKFPADLVPKYRPDDITVMKPKPPIDTKKDGAAANGPPK